MHVLICCFSPKVHSGYQEASLLGIIKLFKRIPGVKALPLEDRTLLLKSRPTSSLLNPNLLNLIN